VRRIRLAVRQSFGKRSRSVSAAWKRTSRIRQLPSVAAEDERELALFVRPRQTDRDAPLVALAALAPTENGLRILLRIRERIAGDVRRLVGKIGGPVELREELLVEIARAATSARLQRGPR